MSHGGPASGHRAAIDGSSERRSSQHVGVLVTGAGNGSANNLIRSLRASGEHLRIFGCHHDRFMIAKSAADFSFWAPSPSDENFADVIRQVIEAERIALVIPTSDHDALAIARIRDRIPTRTFLPATKVIELCHDKYELASHLESKGLAVPATYPLRNRDDVTKIFQRLHGQALLWCRTRTGFGSRGAAPVKDPDQAWSWISYWTEMRGVAVEEFTLSEFLPGRDFNVQGLWYEGRNVLIKMCERLTYLDGHNRPSGMSSTPALAKTVLDEEALDLCERAVPALDADASGVFNIDLKQDSQGRTRITEINAGRFAMITNIYDLTGEHNMVQAYVRLALDGAVDIGRRRDIVADFYLIRDFDTHPDIVSIDDLALYQGFESGDNMNVNTESQDGAKDGPLGAN